MYVAELRPGVNHAIMDQTTMEVVGVLQSAGLIKKVGAGIVDDLLQPEVHANRGLCQMALVV
tara:strand:- start:1421 stop:1606 length:186 start_codon:yes stop_codon:yes gene_type:complete